MGLIWESRGRRRAHCPLSATSCGGTHRLFFSFFFYCKKNFSPIIFFFFFIQEKQTRIFAISDGQRSGCASEEGAQRARHTEEGGACGIGLSRKDGAVRIRCWQGGASGHLSHHRRLGAEAEGNPCLIRAVRLSGYSASNPCTPSGTRTPTSRTPMAADSDTPNEAASSSSTRKARGFGAGPSDRGDGPHRSVEPPRGHSISRHEDGSECI